MDTGKGLFFRANAVSPTGGMLWEGVVRFGEREHTAHITCRLDADPIPTMQLDMEGHNISGLLEMNEKQKGWAEPDLLNLITIDGQKFAAGVWVPRKKQKKKWFLLVLVPAGSSRRANSKPRSRPFNKLTGP